MAFTESLDHCSGEMILSTSSVPKPVVMHWISPEPLIEKAAFTEVKWVLLIANFAKLHLPGLWYR